MQDVIELGWVSHPQQPEWKPLFRTELVFVLFSEAVEYDARQKRKS